ncbi:MAG: hypothetical protein WGN25_04045 [Candidatus Electrothrix sp. GW3-4]|uniref:hypothetical protein n=1 Tax=Candidatus Electrothrix sp. GW3-4 TaxID=3126740 RepID=UPI0030CB0B7E
MDKKEAAFEVTKKHSDSLGKATLEYMNLTGQIKDGLQQRIDKECKECLLPFNDELGCDDIKKEGGCFLSDADAIKYCSSFRVAQKKMLDLLPDYRHPTKGILTELEIFFGDTGCEFFDTEWPSWMKNYNFREVTPELSKEIREYVRDAEYIKKHLIKEYKKLESLVAAAREAYKERDKDDSHKRNARVVQALGLSSGKKGNRLSRDHRGAYEKYVRLVRNEGKSREESLEFVQQEFDYNSVDSARKSLYAELRKVKNWWSSRDDLDSERSCFSENYWKGLIPSKKL